MRERSTKYDSKQKCYLKTNEKRYLFVFLVGYVLSIPPKFNQYSVINSKITRNFENNPCVFCVISDKKVKRSFFLLNSPIVRHNLKIIKYYIVCSQ